MTRVLAGAGRSTRSVTGGFEGACCRREVETIALPQAQEKSVAVLPRGWPLGRTLDFILGVPALAAVSAIRRTRSLPESPKSILLLPAPTIGDTLLSGILIPALRERWPHARMVVAVFSTNRVAAELMTEVDGVVPLDLRRPRRTITRLRELSSPGIVLDTSAWPRITALLSALSGFYSVGFARAGQGRHLALDASVPHRDDLHETENYLALLRELGVDTTHARLSAENLRMTPCPDVVPPGPYVVFHPWASGTGKRLKEWPAAHWVALSQALYLRGLEVVVTGGPDDVDDSRKLVEACHSAGTSPVSLAGQLSLPETGWAMRHASTVVSVNTGVMHLAAISGARLVALHGPTNPSRWGPLGPAVDVVGPTHGGGFLSLGFEFRGKPTDTMNRLTVERVLHSIDRPD